MSFIEKIKQTLCKPMQYDLDSVEGITCIPVRNDNPTYNNQPIYYALQRKATEHKKNGNIHLAIECLYKSNAISDTYPKSPLSGKDYLRLPKYISITGNKQLAQQEENNIHMRHPELFDKRINNREQLISSITNAKRLKCDLIFISSSKNCPICGQFNQLVYSISGKSKKYSKIPDILFSGVCPNHYIGYNIHFDI